MGHVQDARKPHCDGPRSALDRASAASLRVRSPSELGGSRPSTARCIPPQPALLRRVFRIDGVGVLAELFRAALRATERLVPRPRPRASAVVSDARRLGAIDPHAAPFVASGARQVFVRRCAGRRRGDDRLHPSTCVHWHCRSARIAAGGAVLPRVDATVAGRVRSVLFFRDAFAAVWRANRRLDVFPVALGVLLLYHVGTLTLHRLTLWNAFCEWFLGLPLS